MSSQLFERYRDALRIGHVAAAHYAHSVPEIPPSRLTLVPVT